MSYPTLQYPTLEEVEAADRIQLARWVRYLKGPGEYAIGKPDFEEVCDRQVTIMNAILDRFKSMGGMTPEISKQIDR